MIFNIRIAIISITRDRLFYTRTCFETLQRLSGYPYYHIIIDNGSTDGTVDWLEDNYFENGGSHHVTYLENNKGIGYAWNLGLEKAREYNADLIIKMDNDCEVVTPGILREIVQIYGTMENSERWALSPKVGGIYYQPKLGSSIWVGNHEISKTGHIGGLFYITPARMIRGFSFATNMPKARGYDTYISSFVAGKGNNIGYIQTLHVNHFETTAGQAERYPEYFQRKKIEECTR